jgi:hypothetical protein
MYVLVRRPQSPRRVWLLQGRDTSGLPDITGGTEQLTYGSQGDGKDHHGLALCGSLDIGFRNAVAGILWTATGAKRIVFEAPFLCASVSLWLFPGIVGAHARRSQAGVDRDLVFAVGSPADIVQVRAYGIPYDT